MAYHTFNSIAEYRMAIDRAIDEAMEDEVLNRVQLEMMDSIEQNVYGAYSPEYTGRPGTIKSPRRVHGGLKDRANLFGNYTPGTKTLTVEAIADWQNVGFRTTTGDGTYGELSEVIEQEGMYGAPPRPFAWFAEEECKKKIPNVLRSALIRRGL